MARIDVNINPDVLRWAREESGYGLSEIAIKVKVTESKFKTWETNGEHIPLGKLRAIANCYKRQLAVFFLSEVPGKILKPKDYRNLIPAKRKFSKKVLLVMRDVAYFCQTALELEGETYWKNRYGWLTEANASNRDSNEAADWLREKLNISIEDQLNWKTPGEAYRIWRNAVESQLGILVFQFRMPLREIQGFCLTDAYPYSIVVNSKHSYTGRIFTIFHELAHILKKKSGVCLWDNITEKQNEEWGYNSFAGNFLVPANVLRSMEDLNEIKASANGLKISPEVFLRRLKEEKYIGPDRFFALLTQLKTSYHEPPPRRDIKIRPEIKSRASRGETFYTLVLDALNQDRISYTRASGVLDLNISRVVREA